jgi:hypothetical protein
MVSFGAAALFYFIVEEYFLFSSFLAGHLLFKHSMLIPPNLCSPHTKTTYLSPSMLFVLSGQTHYENMISNNYNSWFLFWHDVLYNSYEMFQLFNLRIFYSFSFLLFVVVLNTQMYIKKKSKDINYLG